MPTFLNRIVAVLLLPFLILGQAGAAIVPSSGELRLTIGAMTPAISLLSSQAMGVRALPFLRTEAKGVASSVNQEESKDSGWVGMPDSDVKENIVPDSTTPAAERSARAVPPRLGPGGGIKPDRADEPGIGASLLAGNAPNVPAGALQKLPAPVADAIRTIVIEALKTAADDKKGGHDNVGPAELNRAVVRLAPREFALLSSRATRFISGLAASVMTDVWRRTGSLQFDIATTGIQKTYRLKGKLTLLASDKKTTTQAWNVVLGYLISGEEWALIIASLKARALSDPIKNEDQGFRPIDIYTQARQTTGDIPATSLNDWTVKVRDVSRVVGSPVQRVADSGIDLRYRYAPPGSPLYVPQGAKAIQPMEIPPSIAAMINPCLARLKRFLEVDAVNDVRQTLARMIGGHMPMREAFVDLLSYLQDEPTKETFNLVQEILAELSLFRPDQKAAREPVRNPRDANRRQAA